MLSYIFGRMFSILTETAVPEIEIPADGLGEVPVEIPAEVLGADYSPLSSWPSVVVIVLCALLAVVCVALSVIILMQKKRASGIGQAIAGSGETYWSKNKGKSVEGTLEKYTKWGGVAFIVIALLINILL